MKTRSITLLVTLALALAASPLVAEERDSSRDDETTRIFRLLGKNAIWTPVSAIEVDFDTFHTQGMAKIGETLFVSSVEVLQSTERNGTPTDATYDFSIDRSEGAGRGWLFKLTLDGKLIDKVELTDGAIYHPGGIDYDGKWLWVPVAEYRPNSRSAVYRVDPKTLEAVRVATEEDHIGGVVYDRTRGTLHGVSWGSRRFYTWKLSRRGVTSSEWEPNPAFYVDYQDCHYHGRGYMLCGGVGGYSTPLGNIAFGGLELVDLWRGRPEHQIPVNQFIDEGSGPKPGLALTHNAFYAEPRGATQLRFYFMTESDNQAELLVYDATPWVHRP